nr:hypothetical protein [Mycobacterium malmoense]
MGERGQIIRVKRVQWQLVVAAVIRIRVVWCVIVAIVRAISLIRRMR